MLNIDLGTKKEEKKEEKKVIKKDAPKNKEILLFGFTYIIWEYFKKAIEEYNLDIKIPKGILIHGGGWKKMEAIKISNKIFKERLLNKIKLKNIYNYYGLVEQTGSIFIECGKCGCFITSIFSDILIRDKHFNVLKNGKKGIIQLFSLLPTSYPGHSILTEDIGEIINEDGCKCGTKGKCFLVRP